MVQPVRSPCATCHTRCCRESIAPLSGYDMWRIARGLLFSADQFVRILPQTNTSSHGFALDASGQTFYLTLQKVPSIESDQACVFWMEIPGGTGRCGIYSLRPQVCRTYPAVMRGSQVELRGDVLCPAGAWLDGSLQRPSWRDNLFSIAVEFDIYRMAVGKWNRHVELGASPRTPEEFISYVLLFYDKIAPVREEVGSADWVEMCRWWGDLRLRGVGPLVDTSINPGRWSSVIQTVRGVTDGFFQEDPAREYPWLSKKVGI